MIFQLKILRILKYKKTEQKLIGIVENIELSIDINTDSANYTIGFEYDYQNPFNSETLGVNRMVILDEDKNTLVLVDNENINKGY